jgi:hypothetical protein
MPLHQLGKRGLILAGHEFLEQAGIGNLGVVVGSGQ